MLVWLLHLGYSVAEESRMKRWLVQKRTWTCCSWDLHKRKGVGERKREQAGRRSHTRQRGNAGVRIQPPHSM